MGKSWKGRSHLNTGYPYNPIRVAHLQGFGAKAEDKYDDSILLGESCPMPFAGSFSEKRPCSMNKCAMYHTGLRQQLIRFLQGCMARQVTPYLAMPA